MVRRHPPHGTRALLKRRLLRPVTDELLVARFRAGDDAAFTEIVERYRERLVRYARSMLRARSIDRA